MALFSMVGLIVCSPILLTLEIKQCKELRKNSTIYYITATEFAKNGFGFGYFIINAVLRSLLAFIPLITYNIMTYVKFKKKLIFPSSKKSLKIINILVIFLIIYKF